MGEIKRIENIAVDKLIPYVNNAKKHTEEQVTKIASSIREFGFLSPVLIDKEFNIIAGHGRVMAAKKLDIKEVPCVFVEGLTDEQRKAYILADNRLGELAEWDMDLVTSELEMLLDNDFDIDLTGFELPEEQEETEIKEDEVPEEVETRCKHGDLWKLGGHRLICGDSTDINVIDRLMDGVKADMVFTDPPYGVAYTGGMKIENGKIESNGKKQIKNDALDYENLYQFLYDVFANIKVHTKEKSAVYVFYAHSRSREFLNAFHDASLKQRSIIIWHKTSGGFGDFMAQYMNAYEPCIYASNGETVNWYGPTDEKTVWDMDKEKKCDLHPTMKPVALVERAIKNSSRGGQLVLDLFGGSGTTLMASEKNGRRSRLMELDPKYCDVIRRRYTQWAKENGKPITSGCLD
jgi:DNA modification methylase